MTTNKLIFTDSEYNNHQVILFIFELPDKSAVAFDLRDNRQLSEMKEFLQQNKDSVFVSYAANAEIRALLRLGIDVSDMRVIDLMAESRQISMSCEGYFTMDGSLLGQLKVFLDKDTTVDAKVKDEMRELILTKNEWTDDEFDKIILYCYDDIVHLRPLLKVLTLVHQATNHHYTLAQAVKRGHYIRISAEMDHASPGFPVYGGDIETIYANKAELKIKIIKNLPIHWQLCYVKAKDGRFVQNKKMISELIQARGWKWRKTANGGPLLEADYLKDLRRTIPEIEPFYQATKALATLNSADLRDLVENDYIKGNTFAFSARTGRNGLRPKRGYLLNLPKWLRKIIRPHPDTLMVILDWSQQEIAIAAALSGDKKLLEAYESGDVYLSLGKMSGVIPEDGTKQSHALERELFKALQLGLAYGKGKVSLGSEFYAIMRNNGTTESEARSKALQIYTWHKTYFKTYWDWIAEQINTARHQGWISTQDDWIEFVGSSTKDTQLLNFPSQATGATMMRRAAELFYQEWQAGNIPPVMCNQHDSFVFILPTQRADEYMPKLREIMRISSIDTIGIEVRSGSKIYTNEKGYLPEGWQKEHEELWQLAIKLKERENEK